MEETNLQFPVQITLETHINSIMTQLFFLDKMEEFGLTNEDIAEEIAVWAEDPDNGDRVARVSNLFLSEVDDLS